VLDFQRCALRHRARERQQPARLRIHALWTSSASHCNLPGAGPISPGSIAWRAGGFFVLRSHGGIARGARGASESAGGRQRSQSSLQVPTPREAGYDFKTGGWFGWQVPVATPSEIIERISADASRVMARAAFRDKYGLAGGMGVLNLQASAAVDRLKGDREKFLALTGVLDLQLAG